MATAWVERRLAAILAADVVGYSRLVEKDEAGTLAALKALRREVIDPLLAEHHGRIVKLMGDGALAEFGSVVDAVACAVAVQKGVADRQDGVPPERRIVFRIGINLGDVVVEGEDLLGDGVNIAARLEQICEPGGVLISGTAYDHLQGKLDLPIEFAGEQRVKNIARPIRTYRMRLGRVAASAASACTSREALAAAAAAVLPSIAGRGGLVASGRRDPRMPASRPSRCCRSTISAAMRRQPGWPTGSPRTSSPIWPASASSRCRPQLDRDLQGQGRGCAPGRKGPGGRLRAGGLLPAAGRAACARPCPADRCQDRNPRLVRAVGPPGRGCVRRPDRDRRAGRQPARERRRAHPGAGRKAAKRKRPENLGAYELYLLGTEKLEQVTKDSADDAVRLLKQASSWTRRWLGPGSSSPGPISARSELRCGRGLGAACSTRCGRARRRARPQRCGGARRHGRRLRSGGGSRAGRGRVRGGPAAQPGSAEILTFYAGWASSFGKPDAGPRPPTGPSGSTQLPAVAGEPFSYAYFMRGATRMPCR